jgi:hypothetical protein
MRSSKTLAAMTGSAALLLALVGCSNADPEPTATPDAPAPVVTPTTTPTPEPRVFSLPDSCDAIFPQTRVDSWESEGIILLGGPDGKYGNAYLNDETPEERAGGISCIWGYEDSEVSSFTVSVAPLAQDTRAGIVESFTEQGLNETTDATGTVFSVQGDTTLNPAVFNRLVGQGWVSVLATIGGPEAYAESVAIADEVSALVYTTE